MIPGVVSSQVTYTPSWKQISGGGTIAYGPNYSTVVNWTISGVPSGVPIRIRADQFIGGGQWDYDVVVSTSTSGGSFTSYDYMDEGTDVYVYGNVSWGRTSDTNIQFLYFMDYSNVPPGNWNPRITGIDAYY